MNEIVFEIETVKNNVKKDIILKLEN